MYKISSLPDLVSLLLLSFAVINFHVDIRLAGFINKWIVDCNAIKHYIMLITLYSLCNVWQCDAC